MTNQQRLKPSEVKRIALTIVLKKFFELDEILSEMKDEPKGKKAAVEKEFELLAVDIKKALSKFVKHIKERAESGAIIMPTVVAKELWDEVFANYLERAVKLDAEAEKIMNSQGFKKLMNTPLTSTVSDNTYPKR